MVVYVQCPKCATEQVIKMIEATDPAYRQLPALVQTQLEMMKTGYELECTNCQQVIVLLDETLRFRD
jgi:hypothetical protein